MGPLTAISTAFTDTFNFSGRSSRSAYWWYVLFYTILCIATVAIDTVMIINAIEEQGQEALYGINIFSLASTWAWIVTLPSFISLTVRRLHDAGFSGFWIFLYFVPLGAIALIILHMMPSQSVATSHGIPASAPAADRKGKAVTMDSHQRAMQGYALLFDKDKKPSAETQAARKAEISDYYRNNVLKPSA